MGEPIREQPGSVCFVTGDFDGITRNSGIGTHVGLMSRVLARRGWEVHVLFHARPDDESRLREAPAALAREGITFTAVKDLPAPPWAKKAHYGGDARSEEVLDALEMLHPDHRFDLVEFPDWHGLGLRAIQAKAAGDALLDVRLAVKLHGATQWQRDGNLHLRSAPHELKLEFCERYAFERADAQLSPSRYMLDHMRGLEWAVRDDAVVAQPYPDPEPEPTAGAPGIRELVFFGRLERRKGLDLFLDALDAVEPAMPALFLGKDTHIDGRSASELIAERLGDRPHRIEHDLDREGALAQLRRGDRLAVIASRAETFGFTVAECVANRIPFIAARAGGIPEVIDHPEGRRRWLFEPTAAGLRDALTDRLSASSEDESQLRAEVAAACDPDRWNDRVEATYRELVARPPRPAPRAREPATVTVAVPHYDHERFLPGALASLAAQTRPPDEVIVIDDGSTSEAARRVFTEQEALYPAWTFLRQENTGPGTARNRALDRASGTYFLPFDSDNIATPRLVESLLEAMERNPSRSVTTCHLLAFVDDADIDAGRFVFRYSPIGGPRLAACLEDVFGDTCALFRADALRAAGGFEVHRWSPNEDWETFVKMALRGMEIAVLPRPLFYYRVNAVGRLQTLTNAALTFRQRAHMIDSFFADAQLTARERRDLWECLLAFEAVGTRPEPLDRLRAAVATTRERMKQQRGRLNAQRKRLNEQREKLRHQRQALKAQSKTIDKQRQKLTTERERRKREKAAREPQAGPTGLLRRAGSAIRRQDSGSSRAER